MNWLRYVFVLALSATTLASFPAAANTTCWVEATALNFNSANPSGATTATISYECLTFSQTGDEVAVAMCLAIGPGSPPGTVLERQMSNAFADPLPFQIYKDPSHNQVWGDSPAPPSHLEHHVPPYTVTNFLGFGVGYTRGEVNVYGELSLLPDTAAGDYRSSLNARMTYSYRESKNNPNAPKCDQGNNSTTEVFQFEAIRTVRPSCTVVTASDMNFSPGGMPLSGTRTGDLTSTSTIDLTCTKRTAWQVGLDDGQNPVGGARQMCNSGGACIAYQLNQPDGATPWGDELDVDTVDGISVGTQQTLTVNGRVNDQPLTQAGRYSDTVKVILTY
ncbi:Csu type fimbrial protein [Novilysobacter erysipheiresistens]|uniref:Spore coat protein U domain-containing protein n=1 Tax=Novilysobacter erysipheiresistens TaxID=1749332 RepID=A0ABU7YU75_9GAMM